MKLSGGFIVLCFLSLSIPLRASDSPQYNTNPFVISIPVTDANMIEGGNGVAPIADMFMTADLNGDDALDYIFRTTTQLHAYKHDGSAMGGSFPISIPLQVENGGASFGVSDVDGDNQVEIIAINTSNQIKIYNGATGTEETTYSISGLLADQRVGHIVIANLRGAGDRDAVIQTVDLTTEGSDRSYYINRSLIAINLQTGSEIWRVNQDGGIYSAPFYEGYWGQAHGPLKIADVDGDGLDEVVGGTMVDDDGTVFGSSYFSYNESWIKTSGNYLSHLDAISIGDFRPDLAGLEWVILEEDDVSPYSKFHTILMNFGNKILWQKIPTELLSDPDFTLTYGYKDFEPQNVCVGNFDLSENYGELWNSSRFPVWTSSCTTLHPWVLDAFGGSPLADYRTSETLPSGFNPNTNAQGIEAVCTIDWDGGPKEYIAGISRHFRGNAGVFDAMTGQAVWATNYEGEPAVLAYMMYVADVAGDPREEVIICDKVGTDDYQLKIYHNEADNNYPAKPEKWDDPLYMRVKQNWDYYSPGSYTEIPAKLELKVYLQGPYKIATHAMSTSLLSGNYLPLTSPYSADARTVTSLPSNMVDWVLVELRESPSGAAVYSRSAFLLNDGTVTDASDLDGLYFYGISSDAYYIVVKHRNHLNIMCAAAQTLTGGATTSYDFTTSSAQYSTASDAVEVESGVWGMIGGNTKNTDQAINIFDYVELKTNLITTGYKPSDVTMDGAVNIFDYVLTKANLIRYSQVP